MSEFKLPGLPASATSAAAQGPGAGGALPQDLTMILELMGPAGPDEPAAPKESAEEVIARLEGRQAEAPEEGEVVVEGTALEGEKPAQAPSSLDIAKAGDSEEDSDSENSDSSSSDDDSDSSSVSSASRSVAAGPSAAIVASHARNSSAVDRLTREASPADSEPELDADFFKSANELPAPTQAPVLPFERIPEGQGSRELGAIQSVVGKMVIIAHRVGGLGREAEDVLGEGTVVCWKDGRVLGVVHDTFGPLTSPMYTLILPDPFAPPTAPPDEPSPPTAAAAEEGALAADVQSTEATSADAATPAVAEEATAAGGSASAPSPARDEDLEVEALVMADGTIDAPPDAAAYPKDPNPPLPTSADVPESPPAPHRALPPAFPKADLVGLTVYYPVQLSNHVPVALLKRQRWTDASNKFDEEVGDDEMDWSDDEAEAAAKRRRKMNRSSRAGSTRGGSPTPSMNSQWGGSHFDADSDGEGTVLNYSAAAEPFGAASLPKRPMPLAYDDLDTAGEQSRFGAGGEGSSRGGRGGRERGTGRGKGKERAFDGPSVRGGHDSARGGGGRGGGRGGARGGFDSGRGIGRPRGRGGAGNTPFNPHGSFDGNARSHPPPPPPPPQQQQQHAPGSAPPSRPLSPTSAAIARATGQFPGGAAPPAGAGPPSGFPPVGHHPFPGRPFFPPQGYPPFAYGQPMPPAYGRPPPAAGQPPQHAFGAPAPGAFSPYNLYSAPPPQVGAQAQPLAAATLQQALQQQQAEHNKQLLEMQRQIALLSRKQQQQQQQQPKADEGGGGSGAP